MFARGFYGHSACFGAGGLWGGLVMLGAFLIVGALIMWFIKKGTSKDDQFIDDLKMQFVLGKVSEEDYLKKREILKRK